MGQRKQILLLWAGQRARAGGLMPFANPELIRVLLVSPDVVHCTYDYYCSLLVLLMLILLLLLSLMLLSLLLFL